MNSADELSCLRDSVRLFDISFRLRPIYVSLAENVPEIGFEMELTGNHQSVGRHVQGKCAQCQQALLGLLELADQSLRQEEAYARHFSTHCEKVVHYTSSAGDWPEVVLRVIVIRNVNLEDVATDRLTQLDQLLRLTEDIKQELSNLGCREVSFDGITELPPPRDIAICARTVA